MKKILAISLFFILNLTTAVHADESISIYAPPSIWVQKAGDNLTGPIIDLVENIFGKFNVTVATKAQPWARAIDNMKSGELDLIPVIFYTDERAEFMEFSISYIDVPTGVFVPQGKPFSFAKLEDLKDKRGLMMLGDSISSAFAAYESELNITKVTNYEQIFKMLGDNRADYAVTATYGFLIHAIHLGYEDKIELLPQPVATRSLHFAFSKKSPFLQYLPIVNKKLQQLKTDGSIEKMVSKAIRLASEK